MGADSVAALAYLTLFATVAAFLCYNFALSRLPATRVAVFINAIPVVSLLAAFLILGERLTPPRNYSAPYWYCPACTWPIG